MNVNRHLFYNYMESFNFKYEETNPLKFKGQDLELELKKELKNRNTFMDLKDLIINSANYPIFTYAAKLYKEDFLQIYKENDSTYTVQNAIGCILANDMIYLDTIDPTKIPDMHNYFYLVDNSGNTYINPQVSLKNRFSAMKSYNPTIATKIFNSSMAYFNLYKTELNYLQDIKLEDTPMVFKSLQSYHARKYVLNNYLFDSTSDIKDNTGIFFSVLDDIEAFVLKNNWADEFKEDIDHIRIAYNFRNK